MRHNSTLRHPTSNSIARTETLEECSGSILYLDEQHLTRDCISRELARRLPEFTIIERATVQDLASDDPELSNVVLVILYVHADRMNLHAGGSDLDPGSIAAQLLTLEGIVPEAPRVLMSEVEVPEDILEAFRRHVRGYVPTTLPMKQVAEAIRLIAVGGTFVPLSILSLHGRAGLAQEAPHSSPAADEPAGFSPRQNEVLRMLWNGSSNKVIAYELRMSESTVKVHIRHIMKKLNVNNRTQVVLRTRPLRLEKEPNTIPVPAGARPELRAPTSNSSASDNRPPLGQMGNRSPLDLSKEFGMHNNVHRG